MKKLIALFMAVALTLSTVTIYADEVDDRIKEIEAQIAELEAELKELKASKQSDDVLNVEYNGFELEYLSHGFEKGQYTGEVFAVYFNFTNNSDETQAACYEFDIKLFQNGVELKDNYMLLNQEQDNFYNEVRPGSSATICVTGETKDKSTPIEVEVREYLSFFGDDVLGTQMLYLQ